MQVSFKPRPSRRRVHPAPTTRRIIAIGASSALTALLLAGCGGGGASTSSGAVSGAAARESAQLNAAPGVKSAPGASTRQVEISKPGTQTVGVGTKLTRSASLDLRVKDIGTAAARVRTIAAGLQAIVLSEQIGNGGPGDPLPVPLASSGRPSNSANGFGTLTLSVPADKLDIALDQLAAVGTVLQRTTSSQDVTSQYVDTQSRLKTMSASVERVRALMAQAKDLGQVVALESELSRREADLEAMQSQLDALRTSVERSTLAVSLSTPGNEPVTVNGFMAGLRSGWDAFTASASALLRGVGALLPFAVFFALLGAPVLVWWRRRGANHSPVVPTPVVPAPAE
jgi:hypothetical protein